MSDRLKTSLLNYALIMAIQNRKKIKLIWHTYRGSR